MDYTELTEVILKSKPRIASKSKLRNKNQKRIVFTRLHTEKQDLRKDILVNMRKRSRSFAQFGEKLSLFLWWSVE